jgi:hypothetical protein
MARDAGVRTLVCGSLQVCGSLPMEWDVLDLRRQTLCRNMECGEVGLGLGSWVGLGSEQLTHLFGGLEVGCEVG